MKRMYIYIMSNKREGRLYTGVTNDLVRRVYEHKNKLIEGFSKKYNLSLLVYYECYDNAQIAIEREKQIKGYRRSKKIALIVQQNPQWVDLYPTICD